MGTSDPASCTATSSDEPPLPTFRPGSVLADRFTITRFVGRGTWGDVYQAVDRRRSERVALKVLSGALAEGPGSEQLAEEIRRVRRVAHRRVCRLHELHEHRTPASGSVRFLVTEFVKGETLAARVARGPLAPRAAARIARQLLEGLDAAHAAGVLHLDLKTANVMLRATLFGSEPVIMDFSLSRAIESGAPGNAAPVSGSTGYMSPEQLEGRAVLGAASDLFSFGVVLFEMLTGRLPFSRERAKALMVLRLAGPTPLPSQVLPGLTTAFDAFVAKCLARHPTYRHADAASALAALARCRA
jgi:serine/threonine protein kinase